MQTKAINADVIALIQTITSLQARQNGNRDRNQTVREVTGGPAPDAGQKSGTEVAFSTSNTMNPEPQQAMLRAYFAMDDNENVIVRVEDSDGNVVRQYPPEEYLKATELLQETYNNLFDQKT